MARSTVARAAALLITLALAAPAVAQSQPRQYARCSAAERSAPTLSKTTFPAATFEMVEDEVAAPRGQPGPGPFYIRHGVEKVRLAEGVELEVSLGGCNFHGNAYRFRIAKNTTPTTDSKYWIDKAIELLGLIEKGNVDSMVDLPAMKRALQSRAIDPKAAPFRQDSIDGIVPQGGGEDRGRISEAYLVTINQRREDTTLVSVQYIIGPL